MDIVPIPYITTLEQVVEKFNDNLSFFVTFRIQSGSSILANVTIPFCRFREYGDNHNLIEVRSCDCNGSICNHPVQRMYLSKCAMSQYVFTEQINLHYIFTLNVLTLEKV